MQPRKAKYSEYVLLAWNDSNMAGYQWSWSLLLRQRKDRTWSVGARQTVESGAAHRVRGVYGIRDGRRLKEGIEGVFGRDALEGYEPDWDKITARVRAADPALAGQLKQALEEEDQPEPPVPETPAQAWVRRASWPATKLTGAGGLVPAIDSARRRAAVRQYVERYLEQHGRLPTGVHQVNEEMGEVPPGVLASDGLRLAVYRPGRVQLTATFSDKVDSTLFDLQNLPFDPAAGADDPAQPK